MGLFFRYLLLSFIFSQSFAHAEAALESSLDPNLVEEEEMVYFSEDKMLFHTDFDREIKKQDKIFEELRAALKTSYLED